jgi:alpha-N-arabinofuranosidase
VLFRKVSLSIVFIAVISLTAVNCFGVEAGSGVITVTPQELIEKPINPLIYGNFIESGLGRQVDMMWAELLFNRSFEPVSPLRAPVWDWLNRKPGDDLTGESWWHSGYEVNRWHLVAGNDEASLTYHHIHTSQVHLWAFCHGSQSVNIKNDSESKPALLAQDGIFLKRGVSYRFNGFFRTGQIWTPGTEKIDVTVGLYKENDFTKPIAQKQICGVENEWKKFSVEFANPDFQGRASFAVSVPAGKELQVDFFSLMPSDNIQGWRKETVEALLRVNPTIVRFPGGCYASFYNWRDGIGPRRQRRPRQSEYWGGLENNDVGTAEFVTLCRLLSAKPFLCANVMNSTAAEAADWVEYCNGAISTRMGSLRKSHGYPEPFEVKYWELDNETYRKFGAIEYAHLCVDYAKAMKAVDPEIKLVMVGYWRYRKYLAEMLDIAGGHIDIVTDRTVGAFDLLKVIREYNRKTGRDIRLSNTEWLTNSSDVPVVPDALNRPPLKSEISLQNREIRWRYAMNAAASLLVLQNMGGDFVFANFNNTANTWGQNVIECAKEDVYLSATGRMFELLSRSPAAWVLDLDNLKKNKELKVQAAWDIDRKQLVLIVLNFQKTEVPLTFDYQKLNLKPAQAQISILSAASAASFNSLANPDAIKRNDSQKNLSPSSGQFEITAPANSIAHIILR